MSKIGILKNGGKMDDNVKIREQNEEAKKEKQEKVESKKAEQTQKADTKKSQKKAVKTKSTEKKEISPKKKSAKKKSEPDQTSMENQFEKYGKSMEKVQTGNIVEGTIIKADSSEMLVDIGFKSEGIIPISEFKNPEEAKKGNKIWVYIIRKENRQGRPQLSKRMADEKRYWYELEKCYKENKVIAGKIKNRVKGGMMVDLNGIDAFLPGSQISNKTLPSLDHLVGKEYEYKIITFDREKENVVISHKLVIEEKISQKQTELLENLKEGNEVEGVVKNILNYGVFVDLGGIDGLLHISDMSWGHVNHPSELLKIGNKIKVKVLSFDPENRKIGLGLKQLVPHPWKNIEIKYPEGSKVEGVITNLTKYGAFVELEKGVEGLIHISEMSWTKQISHPKQIVQVGDKIKGIVLDVDKDEHKISVGLKQIEPNPWLTIDVKHPVGSKIIGKIKNITNFGAFMEIEKDIDGLIHISDLSWTKRILHPREVLKNGQEVTAVVLSIDKVMQKIALGIKQLEPDPWENIEDDFQINSEHNVKIKKIILKGIIVQANNAIEGFIPTSHLGIPGLENVQYAFEEGEEIPVKVIEVDKENRRLIFSVKTYFFGREEKEVNNFVTEHLERIKAKRKEAREKKEKEIKKREKAEITESKSEEPKEEKNQEEIKTEKEKSTEKKTKKKKEKKKDSKKNKDSEK